MFENRIRTFFLIGLASFFFIGFSSIGLGASDSSVPRSFEISDQEPYPGKFNLFIMDQQVNEKFSVYIYVTTPGGQEKDDAAEDVVLTMYNDAGDIIQSWGPLDKPKDVDYIEFPIKWPENVYVTLKVTGTILKNGKDVESATGFSNYFWIGTPIPPPPTPSEFGQLIWEQEILE